MDKKTEQTNHGAQSTEVIVFCMKKRFSGVTATIDNLLPRLAKLGNLAYVGPLLPHAMNKDGQNVCDYSRLRFIDAVRISLRRLKDGRKRIWHLRRNKEMLLAILCRDVFRLPINLVFTSAAIKKHSAFPRWLIRQMDVVIATSPEAAKVISNTRGIVPHGVDISRFCLPKGQPLTSTESDTADHEVLQLLANKRQAWRATGFDGTYGIGIFGRVREEKGIHLFVDAMLNLLPAHPDFTAFIAGLCQPNDQAYKQQMVNKIEQAGLSERILFVGDISSEDMPLWYQRSLIAVACPLYEGYGLTILESMACGCAAVASRTGAFASMVVADETGQLVELNDSQSLTNALKPMLMDVQKTAVMGLKGRQRVEMLFPIEKEAEGIYQNYQYLWATSADSME